MIYKTNMQVKLEDEVYTVVESCSSCDQGWQDISICTECNGLVNGSDTYYYQKDLGYKISKEVSNEN